MLYGKLTQKEFEDGLKNIFKIEPEKFYEEFSDTVVPVRTICKWVQENYASDPQYAECFVNPKESFINNKTFGFQGFDISVKTLPSGGFRIIIKNETSSIEGYDNYPLILIAKMWLGETNISAHKSEIKALQYIDFTGQVTLIETKLLSGMGIGLEDSSLYHCQLEVGDIKMVSSRMDRCATHGPVCGSVLILASYLDACSFTRDVNVKRSELRAIRADHASIEFCTLLTAGCDIVNADVICARFECNAELKSVVKKVTSINDGENYVTLLQTMSGPLVIDNLSAPRFITLGNWFKERVTNNTNKVQAMKFGDYYNQMKTITDIYELVQ